MRITNLTFLAFNLNAALDTGRHNSIGIEEVSRHVDTGTIFGFLEEKLGRDIDLSIFGASERQELIAEWRDLLNAVSARRKFGVENNGLCLLVAYLLQGIQQRQDRNPGASS